MRHKTIGFPFYFHLIEYADQLYVPEPDWNDIRFQKLLELAATHVIFVNDFFSYEKEMREQNNEHGKVFNPVSLIIQIEGLSVGKAFESLAKIIGDLEKEILIVENEILCDESFSKDTRTFIERMNYLMGGHFKVYSNVFNRYYQAK